MSSDQALPPIRIVDARILLRPFEPTDAPAVFEASADPLIPLITTVPRGPASDSDVAAFIERQNGRRLAGQGWSLAIADAASGAAVGQVGLWVSHAARGRAELGYWITTSARGHGYAAAALGLLGDWAFENLDLNRLTLYIEPWNSASIRTAENAGYTREACLEQWEQIDGEGKDMWSYARLREARAGATPAGRVVSDLEVLRALEDGMWTPATRNDPEWMRRHTSPDFVEFGRSGRRYNQAEILESIGEFALDEPLSGFTVQRLAPDVRLVTYQSLLRGDRSNRSSIWCRQPADVWQMTFHQGTPTG